MQMQTDATRLGPAGYPVPPGQQVQHFEHTAQRLMRLDYLLYLPEDYGAKNRVWPLVLFLHGAGERGSDIERVKIHGPAGLIEKGKAFPFILVSPQCPDDQVWDPYVLDALLDEVIAGYKVDPDRVYCTGLSMGGYGTWAMAMAYPRRFAAIVPICGGGCLQQLLVPRIRHLPVWCFHGAKDSVVPLSESQILVDQLKECGGDVRFTLYPDAGHDAWTQTYDDPEVYAWLLAHRRRPAGG
jgi:predicted peptidase